MKTGLAAVLLLTCAASSADALAMRTWISGTGNDNNPCSRTAPCRSFEATIAQTAAGGEITMLDPGGSGAVFIDRSITINGTPGSGYGSVFTASAIATNIMIKLPDNDPYKTVRLNWLDINGAGKSQHGIRILDGQPAGVSVVIENTNIDGFTGSGILDERSMGGKLVVADTVVRHTQQSGIFIAAGGKNPIRAMLSNVRVHNSAHAALLAYGGARVMVSNSVFSGSSIGIDVETPGTEMLVEGSTITGNFGAGFNIFNGGLLLLSNCEVSFNKTDIAGPVQSFSDNRFIGNGAGDPVSPIGQPSSPTGQQ
jgi:hypothetical protein